MIFDMEFNDYDRRELERQFDGFFWKGFRYGLFSGFGIALIVIMLYTLYPWW